MAIRLINICGARPNFMKIAPLLQAYRAYPQIEPVLVHTGQHYDENMSRLFFEQLHIPPPDINLEVGSGSHARQTALIMQRFEPLLEQYHPDAVLVVGDVNSTIACGLVAVKQGVPLLHVEAGLRSFDRSMPEEINRLLTDAISELLFVSEPSGVENLRREGHPEEQIHLVGNVMIDSLRQHLEIARRSDTLQCFHLTPSQYGVITLHRPGNVDHPDTAREIVTALIELQHQLPLIFCIHPRTRSRFEQFGLWTLLSNQPHLQCSEPLGYLEFLHLLADARVVLTDSGGIQEETTILGVPCLTLRENTERPITLTSGTNRLVPPRRSAIITAIQQLDQITRPATTPPLWDGHAAERIAGVIVDYFQGA
ncbi:MAG: UDP-2,3-diacetamido-2,3-dideoxy-D-glucuronate 2-epimerase [Phycisphaerae bacterium]|nr:UDP-2,3-diacetamido-2,3-dideoxy-D-glucuronate 2-epimerase [Phycisphaerae bacterium]